MSKRIIVAFKNNKCRMCQFKVLKKIFPTILFIVLNILLYANETDTSEQKTEDIIDFTETSDLQSEDGIDRLEEPSSQSEDSTNEDNVDELVSEHTIQQNQPKELNFSKDDVVNYITENRKNMVTHNKIYEVPFQDFLRFNNIWLTNTQVPIHASLHKLQNFGTIQNNNFNNEKYPYPVALTRFYAGIGDYKKDFAHITFLKDEFLTIKNLNFKGDYRGESDYQNTQQKFADYFAQTEYSLHDFTLSAIYLSSDRELNPFYYTIDNDYYFIYDRLGLFNLDLSWKFLYLTYFSSSINISAKSINDSFKHKQEAIALGTKLDFDIHQINLSTQYNNNDNLISLHYDINSNNYKFSTDTVIYDSMSKIYSSNDFTANIIKNIYVVGNARYSDLDNPDFDFQIVNHLRSYYALGFGIKSNFSEKYYFDTYVKAGQKNVIQYSSNKLNEKFNTISYVTDINVLVYKYMFNISNELLYDDFSKKFSLLTAYYNTLNLSVTRLFAHDNKMTLGSRMYFLSSVINDYNQYVNANMCINLYLKIGITKIFDINVEINNLTRRGYLGNENLNDLHFTTQLVWYFIN